MIFFKIILFVVFVFPLTAAGSEGNITLQGRVTSLNGDPVPNAEIYLYATKNTRKPADFISPKTGNSGEYRLSLPRAAYWAVARLKKGERFGPLQPGDRHSGEPTRIDPDKDDVIIQDFSIADMQELAQSRSKSRDELIEVSGVISKGGQPLSGNYLFVRKDRISVTTPDFFSAWTDSRGKYSVKLPPGHYYFGTSTAFPPEEKSPYLLEVELLPGKLPVAINLQLPVE